MFINFRGRKRERLRETLMSEGNIDPLPPICAPTGDQTRNLGMCPASLVHKLALSSFLLRLHRREMITESKNTMT